MRRAPLVLSSTAAGLALVLGFHTHASPGIHLGSVATSGTTATTGGPSSTSSTTPGATSTTTASSATASTATTTAASHTATGQLIQYRYGDVQLRVTAKGKKITKVSIIQDDATDPRSADINSQAIPMLTDQVMSAQSSNIDGVSGATYTSQAYYQSLQSALDQLGIQ